MTAGESPPRREIEPCPLCASGRTHPLPRPGARRYRRCAGCGLVFLVRADLPDAASEAAHYRTHDNRPDDPRYRAFLARLVEPLAVHLEPGMAVLDFGSGAGSPVAGMLERCAVEVVEYDPVFRPDRMALERCYDAIVASEVVEHFHCPLAGFARLDTLLRPGGRLGAMTQPLEDEVDFATWWYPRDPTHVAFFAPRTFEWIAAHFRWSCRRVRPSVVLFDKR